MVYSVWCMVHGDGVWCMVMVYGIACKLYE
jgi:hypothetical protein